MVEKTLDRYFQRHQFFAILISYERVMPFGSWVAGLKIVQHGFGKGKVVFSLPNYFISFLDNKLGSKLILDGSHF